MLKERRRTNKIAFVAIDYCLIMLSWWVAYQMRKNIEWPSPFIVKQANMVWYGYLALLGSFVHTIIFLGINLYSGRREQRFFREIQRIVLGSGLNLMAMLAVIFFARPISYSRGLIFYQFIAVIILVSLGHLAGRRILQKLRARGYNIRNVLIAGSGNAAWRFYQRIISRPEYGYRVVGVLGDAEAYQERFATAGEGKTPPYLGHLGEFEPQISGEAGAGQGQVDMVVAALPPGEANFLPEIFRLCEFESIDLKIIPDYFDIITISGRVEEIDGLPVLSIRTVPLDKGYNWLIKRLFDVFFSLFVLIALSPVLLLLAILVKLSSPGPVFHLQERMGLDRRRFKMLKFRTMRVQTKEESGTMWTVKDDPRVTWIGGYLRRFSLDELPQFFNILVGHMSVVGPRAERPHFVEQFKSEVEGYMLRHRMKAGLTGWAQVNGLRGDTSIEERVRYDIYYIENWSLWFDLQICIKTLMVIFRDENAY